MGEVVLDLTRFLPGYLRTKLLQLRGSGCYALRTIVIFGNGLPGGLLARPQGHLVPVVGSSEVNFWLPVTHPIALIPQSALTGSANYSAGSIKFCITNQSQS